MLQVCCSQLLKLPNIVVVFLGQRVFVFLKSLFLQNLLLDRLDGRVRLVPKVLVDVVLLFEEEGRVHLPVGDFRLEDDLGVLHLDFLAVEALLLEILILNNLFLML